MLHWYQPALGSLVTGFIPPASPDPMHALRGFERRSRLASDGRPVDVVGSHRRAG